MSLSAVETAESGERRDQPPDVALTAGWPERDARRWVLATAGSLFAFAVVRNAWLCDDAFITLRVADNIVNGFGPVWNVAERVQVYTHPLWLLALTAVYWLTREPFLTTIALSVALSLAAAWRLATRVAVSPVHALAALGILTCSRAVVDYSTSGLENPLTFLLLALFAARFLRPTGARHLAWLAGLASLLAVNRLDTSLLVAPAVAWAALETSNRGGSWRRVVAALALGALPLVAWELFSLLYYGFPWPNTAWAKLNTGVSAAEIGRQGWLYLLDSLVNDPVTLTVTAVGATLPLLAGGDRRLALSAGIWLYLLYTVSIGGDFMSGRFLGAPLVLAVALVATVRPPAPGVLWLAPLIASVWLLGLIAPTPTLAGDSRDPRDNPIAQTGIANERAYYTARGLALSAVSRQRPVPDWPLIQDGVGYRAGGVFVRGEIGVTGYFAGPRAHIVDVYALADPLLARLPAAPNPAWRIGHFRRDVPPGYVETLAGGQNVIADPRLAAYWDRLALVTRGDLWRPERFGEIVRFLSGENDRLLAGR